MPGMGFGFGFGFHRRASGSGASASEQLLTLATAAGAEAVYDPDNEETWTLRDDGSDLWYSAISDGLGNREDIVEATAGEQPKQITLSTGRKAMRVSANTVSLRGQFSASISQPNTVLVLGRNPDTASGRRRWLDSDFGGTGRQIIGWDDLSASGWAFWSGSWVSSATPALDINWHISHANYNGASGELFFDGSSIATGDSGTNGLDGISIGTAAETKGGVDLGPIIVFSGLKTNAELSDIRDHLNANWPIGEAA